MGDDDVDVILCIRIHGGVFESRRSSDMELITVTIWLEDRIHGTIVYLEWWILMGSMYIP